MKKIVLILAAAAALVTVASTTNVVTNVVWNQRVKYVPKANEVTNGYWLVYGGTLVTSKVDIAIQQMWRGGKLVKVTNSVDVITGGSTTNTVWDINTNWTWKTEYDYVPMTNITNVVTE